jgi:hypothetical protein
MLKVRLHPRIPQVQRADLTKYMLRNLAQFLEGVSGFEVLKARERNLPEPPYLQQHSTTTSAVDIPYADVPSPSQTPALNRCETWRCGCGEEIAPCKVELSPVVGMNGQSSEVRKASLTRSSSWMRFRNSAVSFSFSFSVALLLPSGGRTGARRRSGSSSSSDISIISTD